MPYFGTTEIVPTDGALVREFHPIAASQSLVVGDIVYLNSGKVTKWLANNTTGDNTTLFYGIVAEPTFATVNGTSTAYAVDTLVEVIPFWQKCYLKLRTYGAAPALANICNGASTTGFVIRNDSNEYKINMSVTANPVLRPFAFDYGDSRDNSGRPKFKGTPVVGDRLHCAILDAAKQVIV
jgi:hypothetical protein